MKMRIARTVLTLVVFAASTPANAQNSQAYGCAEALIQDVGRLDLREWFSLARFDLLSRSVARDTSRIADVGVPIFGVPVDGSYEEAERLRDEYFSASSLDWNTERSESVATQTLSRNSVEAYRACVDGAHESGPRVYVHDATQTEMTVVIRWIAGVGQQSRTSNVNVVITGGQTTSVLPAAWRNNEEFGFVVTRAAGSDVRIVANIGGGSDNEFVSLIPDPPENIPVLEFAYCVGRGNRQGGIHLWGPANAACNGLSDLAWGEYNSDVQEVTQLGACIGHGGFDGVWLWGPVGEPCAGSSTAAWGHYGDAGVVDVTATGIAWCNGRGDTLANHHIWGPFGQPCGGSAAWGTYNQGRLFSTGTR